MADYLLAAANDRRGVLSSGSMPMSLAAQTLHRTYQDLWASLIRLKGATLSSSIRPLDDLQVQIPALSPRIHQALHQVFVVLGDTLKGQVGGKDRVTWPRSGSVDALSGYSKGSNVPVV